MTRIATLIVAGMLLAASTGCAGTAGADAPTTEPPSQTSSTAPESAPALVAKPAPALGGTCDALIDDGTLSHLVGAQVAPSTAPKSERVWALAVLGGLDCGWVDEAGEAYIWLDVLPAAGLEARAADAQADSPYCYGGGAPETRCSFSTVVDGYWLSGIVGVAAGSTNSAVDAIDALSARLAEAATLAKAVPAERPDGMWVAGVDCTSFGAAVDTESILGSAFEAQAGSRGGEVTPGFIGALVEVGDVPCNWATSGYERWFSSEVLPGAGWAITELAARDGAASVAVDGALEAVAVPLDGDITAVYATDGANLAWFSAPADIDEPSVVALVSAVMAAASR